MAVAQGGKVHLRYGGTGDRRAVKGRKDLVHRTAKRALYGGNGNVMVERWHPVLKTRQFIGDVCG
ncbi:hypothetical protein D3C80_1924620 [compost metagenome]